MAKERLQKLLAQAGLCSRRQAEQWIADGRVRVNGAIATIGQSGDPERDRIIVDHKPLVQPAQASVVCLLYKPVGYVTTSRDPQGRPTVLDLVRRIPGRLFPVGRLDLTTEGLLLLTNDGVLAHHLMHPSHQVPKTYLVKVRGTLTEEAALCLRRGVSLDDGPTAPAELTALRYSGFNSWFELTLHEGRNRQVRRMCEAVGYPVVRLKRIRYGFLDLAGLRSGQSRLLTAAEIARLRTIAEEHGTFNS